MLKMINDKFYSCRKDGFLFTLKYSDRGVLSWGKAWYFYVCPENGEGKQCIATFCTKDDGHNCYKNDCESRLWSGISEVLPAANKMLTLMLES